MVDENVTGKEAMSLQSTLKVVLYPPRTPTLAVIGHGYWLLIVRCSDTPENTHESQLTHSEAVKRSESVFATIYDDEFTGL